MLMQMTTTDRRQTAILLKIPLANSPMMKGLEVKQRVGMMAKGNWIDITVFSRSLRKVAVLMSVHARTATGKKC